MRMLSLRPLIGIWKEFVPPLETFVAKEVRGGKPVKLWPFSMEGKLRNMTSMRNLEKPR